MLDTALLCEGDTHTVNDCTWKWVREKKDGIEAVYGHWVAAKGSKIQVHPPRDGDTVWMVTVPLGKSREMLVQLGEEETAFHYATATHRAHAN